MSEQGAAPPVLRFVEIGGERCLMCGCGFYRWADVSGVAFNGGSGMVEVYLRNATAGSWPTWIKREDLVDFLERVPK